MNKHFKIYAAIWFVVLLSFSIVIFAIPSNGVISAKHDAAFWGGYVFVAISYVAQLLYACAFFNSGGKEKKFLNTAGVYISYMALIIITVVGFLCMAVAIIPRWTGVVICVITSGIYCSTILKATLASGIISDTGDKVKRNTEFINKLTSQAEVLVLKADDDAAKAMLKKVYEAIRYSDAVSNDSVLKTEEQLSAKFDELSKAVQDENKEAIERLSNEVILLAEERNRICRLQK